jgi:hypothetical protein
MFRAKLICLGNVTANFSDSTVESCVTTVFRTMNEIARLEIESVF